MAASSHAKSALCWLSALSLARMQRKRSGGRPVFGFSKAGSAFNASIFCGALPRRAIPPMETITATEYVR